MNLIDRIAAIPVRLAALVAGWKKAAANAVAEAVAPLEAQIGVLEKALSDSEAELAAVLNPPAVQPQTQQQSGDPPDDGDAPKTMAQLEAEAAAAAANTPASGSVG